MVDFTMFFRGVIDRATATAPLKQAIESGKLGDFSVSKDSFAITSPTPKPTGEYNHASWWSLRETNTSCSIIENPHVVHAM